MLTLEDFLQYIRVQFLKAREERDDKTLEYLAKAIDVLLELAYEKQDYKTASILEDFMSSITDYFMKVEWKSVIPSEAEIHNIFYRKLVEI